MGSNGKYLVCLGTRSEPSVVRAVQINGITFYPPFGHDFTWDRDGLTFIQIKCVHGTVKIPSRATKDTSYQCWPTPFPSDRSHVYYSVYQFFNLLRQLQ
jgi:hypothetical protein